MDRALVNASVSISQYSHGGSGTVIWHEAATAYVLTNKHVVNRQGGGLTVTWHNGAKLPAELVQADTMADISLVKVPNVPETVSWVPVAEADPQPRTSVFQVGYPWWCKGKPVERAGVIPKYEQWTPRERSGARSPYWGYENAWQVSMSFGTQSGDSGSGVFHAKDKTLVAVIWGGPQGVAVCCRDIRKFLDKVLPGCLRPGRPCPPSNPFQPPKQQPPSQPPKDTNPKRPPADPVQPPVQPDLGAKLDKLLDYIGQLDKKIAEIQLKPGPAGPPGKDGIGLPGKDGKDGAMGPQGPAGKDADAARIAALEDALRNLQGQLYTAQLLDKDGNILQTVTFGKDKPLKIRLVPVQ